MNVDVTRRYKCPHFRSNEMICRACRLDGVRPDTRPVPASPRPDRPAAGAVLRKFLRSFMPPTCPACGPGTMVCLDHSYSRDAWKTGMGHFACRRCGFGGTYQVHQGWHRWQFLHR